MKLKEMFLQILTDLSDIKSDLKYHIKRTDLLEEELRKHRDEFEPVRSHVEKVQTSLSFIGTIGKTVAVSLGAAAALAGVIRLIMELI